MPTSFKLKVKDYNDDGRIVTIGEKEVYNLDGIKNAKDWVFDHVRKIKAFDAPQMSNAITVKPDGYGKLIPNSLGYFYSNGNNVYFNKTNVAIFTSTFSGKNGCSITKDNVLKVFSLFAARRMIESNWTNQKDEYMVPNESHPDYQQFVNDCIVYSLFDSASLQSSLRNITYKGATHNIHNQFFFLSVKEMQDLAIANNFNELYNDTVGKTDTYVYNLLNTISLSPDAKAVVDMARKLVVDSFPLRQAAHQVKPEMHLNAWDAGWYQIRNGILKDNFKTEYKAFTDTYKAFANRLRPLVYQLGFLKA